MADYTNDAQQRILRLITLLAGHEITGIAPADIARQQDCAASMVTRDLDNLRTAKQRLMLNTKANCHFGCRSS